MMPFAPPEALFIDTWVWLALADARDPAHAKVVSEWRARAAAGRLITSDYYRDKPAISFPDLTSFVVMRELGIRNVLTADSHFAQVQLGFRRVPVD